MSARKLRSDEIELWKKVANTTERLSTKTAIPQHPERATFPAETAAQPQERLPNFKVGQNARSDPPANNLAPSIPDVLRRQPVQMDHKAHKKMVRGKSSPEGRIDLHGMTQDQAYPALIGFVLSSHSANRRLILVITGKGKPINENYPVPRRRGLLRQMVPQWLTSGPAASIVMQVTPAHQRHGGSGAYYVYLRRKR